MKFKRILCALLSLALIGTAAPAAFADLSESDGETVVSKNDDLTPEGTINLVPSNAVDSTANYVCTWNIQDWVAWHEAKVGSSDKRDVVDPDHIFGNTEKGIVGWTDVMYPQARGDLIFLLDDGWDLPYGTRKNGTNKEYFGSMVLPTDKFPAAEWGETPQERLKTLDERIKAKGWLGTGLWICAQESSVYSDGDMEAYWRERLEWSKYAGIQYWKIDWGTHQKQIDWRRKISNWAEEIYPELIIEHVVGGGGKNDPNGTKRISESDLLENVEYAGFSDVFRTYDVLDNMMTTITLDRVGEQLFAGYTEEGNAMGLINAEDEMYISASLGLSFGVMRFPVELAADTNNSGAEYYGKGTEPGTYFAGGKAFVDTRATRNSLDEVTRAAMWQRIAPAYAVGDYDTKLSDAYLTDSWTFVEKAWDGTSGTLTQKAPAAIARGIDLPTATSKSGDVPYLTASRNPNGAISIAAFCRTYPTKGYTPIKDADVTLNVGDLTGKIGVFGYYGSLTLTFNQDLTGKTIYAQDLLADKAQDITDQVTINGKTLTIDGKLLERIGLSAASEGDTSEPGLVLRVGDPADYVAAATTNARPKSWDVNNGSFEKFNFDANNGQTMASVTGAGWRRWNNTGASQITTDAHTGSYAGIHTGTADYQVSTYQLNKSIPNGVYKVSAWVKASAFTRTAPGGDHKSSAELLAMNYGGAAKSVDIAAMGKLDDWTLVEIPEVPVTNGQLQVELFTNGAAGEYLIFDDVAVSFVKEIEDTKMDADVILEFDFSTTATDESGVTTVTGTANGEPVSATAQNVTFETDEDGNDIAVFPQGGDNAATGITYAPGDADPMKTLLSGNGVTVSMWIKTAEQNFSSPLLSYGALQTTGIYAGELGASMQLHARNGIAGDVMFYRNQSGSTGGHKIPGIGSPYKVGEWQLVTYVENSDGSGTIYVDGVALGSIGASDKTLLGFATDANAPDAYYIGFLPYAVTGDTHFAGAMDSVTIYNKALSQAQIENLYKARFEQQTEITLLAAGADGSLADGVLGGQATANPGYVGWIGHGADAKGDEGTVTFTFRTKEAANWQMDIYYLSKSSSSGIANANIRDFDITINADSENVITATCPEGQSWTDPSLASVYTVQNVSLPKGENTLVFGNPDGNSPSLVKVVLTRKDLVDAAAAAAVENMILEQLGTVDSYDQLSAVQNIRAAYEQLTEDQKALVSAQTYKMLTDAEALMAQWQEVADQQAADAVIAKIQDLGEITSLEQESAVSAARSAYDKLTKAQQAKVTNLAALEAAEAKIQALKDAAALIPGDVDGDGNVNVSDIIKVKNLIMAGEWTDEELAVGDLNNSGKLDVADIIAIKNKIMGA